MKRPFASKRPIGPFVESSSNSQTTLDGEPSLGNAEVFFHSSESMRELRDNNVDLFVTSPPYNVGYGYGSVDDSKAYEDYISLLASVFNEAYQKLTPEGRMCVNVPLIDITGTTTSPVSDILSFIINDEGPTQQTLGSSSQTGITQPRFDTDEVNDFIRETDYNLEEFIIWNKGKSAGKSPPGSIPRNRQPYRFPFDTVSEAIIVLQKPGRRDLSNIPPKFRQMSRLSRGWTDYTGDNFDLPKKANVWNIRAVADKEFNGELIPTFPEELPRRLIQAYSFVGDTVVDPFVGSGVTLKVASELDRSSVGYETRSELRPVIEDTVGQSV